MTHVRTYLVQLAGIKWLLVVNTCGKDPLIIPPHTWGCTLSDD